MATLKQFLQTGELGPIHPGMSQNEAVALLGPPQDESVAKHPQILKFGGLQLTFLVIPGGTDRLLTLIGLHFGPQAEPIPEPTSPSDFKGMPTTTMTEVRDFLTQAKLSVAAVVEGGDTNYLILPSGARITFDGQNLWSIHFAAPARPKAKKQISVSISEDTQKRLNTLAQESNQSLSELCSDWITQKANDLERENANGIGVAR